MLILLCSEIVAVFNWKHFGGLTFLASSFAVPLVVTVILYYAVVEGLVFLFLYLASYWQTKTVRDRHRCLAVLKFDLLMVTCFVVSAFVPALLAFLNRWGES